MSKFGLLFLVFFVGGIISALSHNGAISFIVYELVYFLNPANRWWFAGVPHLRYSFIVVLVMLFILAKNYRQYSTESPWAEITAFKWMIALLMMYYIAYSFAINWPDHNRFTFDFTKLVIIVLVAYKLINSKKALDACIWAYFTGCVYIGHLAMVTGRNAAGRVEGIGMIDSPDANDTAAVLVPSAVLLMCFAWQGSIKSKLLAVIMGAFIANGLVLINSRGAFLGVVLSLSVFLSYMIFSRHQKRGQKATAISLIIFGLAGAFSMTDDIFWERMGSLTKDKEEMSGAGRTTFWLMTFDMLEDHPFGMGVNGYNIISSQYMDEETRGGVANRAVHSTWFQGLSELGWFGIIVFFGLLISLAMQSQKAKKYAITNKDYDIYFKILAFECALLGYLVAGTFINRFRAEMLYWLILFLSLAIKFYYLQPKREKQQLASNRKTRNQHSKTTE